MARPIIAVPLLVLLCGCGLERETPSTNSDAKYQELADLPVGLEIIHTPNPGPAQRGGPSGVRYSWVYETSVRATGEEPVTITEFGAFAWLDGRWVFANFTGEPFTTDHFEEWYSCPQGKVLPSKPAIDPQNWSGSDDLKKEKSLWYYIGVTPSGKRVKGEAVVEHQSKVKE